VRGAAYAVVVWMLLQSSITLAPGMDCLPER
jgi:hypothetical protein